MAFIRSPAKLGGKSRAFIKKTVDVAVQNPGVLSKMRTDAQLLDSLVQISMSRKLDVGVGSFPERDRLE